jgi:3-methyladenine DNA glycosylase AlkD
MPDLKAETRGIIAEYQPQDVQHTADVLQVLWSQLPTTQGGAVLIKAEAREELKALGVPVKALDDIGKEIGKVARKRVDDFLPLAGLLWEQYGREGRLVASTFLGPMELVDPDRVLPAVEEMARTCVAWEDCDQLTMRALEPVFRKEPEKYVPMLDRWVTDPNKWVRRAGITVLARLPMKHAGYAATCLRMVEPALGDIDQDVRRAVSFAVRMGARGEPQEVVAFVRRQAHRTDAASIWVLCDAMRSMTKKFLPHFKELLPVYENWFTMVDPKSQRSVASAIKVLRSA